MPSTTRFGVSFPILAAALVASPAFASDESAQLWIYGNAAVPVSEDVTASAIIYQRFRDESHGGNMQVARGGFDWAVDDAVTLGGGVTYVQTASGHQWRAAQQVTLTFGAVAWRTQIEEGFKPEADRPQLRLRERIQATFELDARDRLLLSGEFNYQLRSDTSGEGARVDSLRAGASIQHNLANHVYGTLGYMLIVTPRHGEEDKIAHAPQIGLTYRY